MLSFDKLKLYIIITLISRLIIKNKLWTKFNGFGRDNATTVPRTVLAIAVLRKCKAWDIKLCSENHAIFKSKPMSSVLSVVGMLDPLKLISVAIVKAEIYVWDAKPNVFDLFILIE